jgi:TRAP-type C4-dicarboxylate transport system permease small subunit
MKGPLLEKLMKRFIAWFEMVERSVLSALIASSILMSVAGVFYRYVLGQSLAYVEEFAGLIMAAIIVLGSSMAITGKEHIRVELLIQIFPRLARLLNILAWLTVLFVSAAMTVLTYLFVTKLIRNGQTASAVEWLQIGWPLLIVPVGYAVCCLKAAWILFQEATNQAMPPRTELDELVADQKAQVMQ